MSYLTYLFTTLFNCSIFVATANEKGENWVQIREWFPRFARQAILYDYDKLIEALHIISDGL